MSLSNLSSTDRWSVIAAAVVVVSGVISLVNQWGALMILAVLAGLGVLALAFMPASLARAGSRGTLALVFGAVAAVVYVLAAIPWLGYIFSYLATFDTLQFLAGLVAAIWLAWSGWRAFQAEGSKFKIGSSGAA